MNRSKLNLDPVKLRAAADQAGSLLKALANPDRLIILCQLSKGELCVSELEEILDIHQPTLSQQLGVLRSEGLVDTRREGKLIFYKVTSLEALVIIEALYGLFCSETKGKNL